MYHKIMHNNDNLEARKFWDVNRVMTLANGVTDYFSCVYKMKAMETYNQIPRMIKLDTKKNCGLLELFTCSY